MHVYNLSLKEPIFSFCSIAVNSSKQSHCVIFSALPSRIHLPSTGIIRCSVIFLLRKHLECYQKYWSLIIFNCFFCLTFYQTFNCILNISTIINKTIISEMIFSITLNPPNYLMNIDLVENRSHFKENRSNLMKSGI